MRSKPPIAVPGKDRVAPVTDWLGYQRQNTYKRPAPGEVLGNSERSIAPGETSGALHQDKGIQGIRLQSMLLQELSTDLRLEGRKREVAVRIPLDDELDRGRTEMAHTIEEDNGTVGLHASTSHPLGLDALQGICGTT